MRTERSDDVASEREHGGSRDQELAELGIDASEIVDFSVNVNPYGPTPAMLRALREAPVDRYPDPTAFAARRALGRACGVDWGEIVVGSGAADLLWALARSIVRPSAAVVVVEPTFSEFRSAATTIGARVFEWRATAADDFAVSLERVAELVDRVRAEVLYVCAPSSPAGAPIAAHGIAALARAMPRLSIVVDQSFLTLSDSHADASVRFPANVSAVRSLTKDHSIPGVRVGYAIVAAEIARAVERTRAAWSTSTIAQAAVVAACAEPEFVVESRIKLQADRLRLIAALRDLGLEPVRSTAPFVLARVRRENGLRRRLLVRHRVLVRDCRSFGLPEFIRLAARPAAELERLRSALAEEAR